MAEHDRIHPHDAELAAISAALDGEGARPPSPSEAAVRFEANAVGVRRAVRLSEAEPGPDFRDQILRDLGEHEPNQVGSRRRTLAAVAAAFVIGMGVAAAFLLDRDLDSTPIAAAELTERVLAAQTALSALDADVQLTEWGAHPDQPVRRYEGRLQYRSPERLALLLTEVTDLLPGWPANDIEIVVDEDRAWRSRRRACPVDELPGCLAPPAVDGVENRPPFSAGWAAPLDLVLPIDPVVTEAGDVVVADGLITVATTVFRARDLVETTLENGAFRQVHADDGLEIRLDPATLTLRGFSVLAGDTTARAAWATTWGYDDAPGKEVVRVELTPRAVSAFAAGSPGTSLADAGFRDDASLATAELALPEGFDLHRRGTSVVPGAEPTTIVSWVDGRAWITLRIRESGSLEIGSGFTGREARNGVVHVDARANEVVIVTGERRVTVAGSVALDDLVAVAASIPLRGVAAAQDPAIESFTIVVEGEPATVEVGPGRVLPPPGRGDVVGVTLRGTIARHSPTLGTLTWIEKDAVVVVRSRADLDALVEAINGLELP